jgi:signal transduction histidine kinase
MKYKWGISVKYKIIEYFHELIKKSIMRHKEKHRLEHEFQRKINELYKSDSDFHRFHRHIKYTRPILILFNLFIWFLLFRYLGVRFVSIAFAILMSVGGVLEFYFTIGLEKRIFKPISQLKLGVEEISKGNYDVRVDIDSKNEISILVDSFNGMAKKLQDSEKLKLEYEENRKLLIANISHDLKTPITSIQGYLETIFDRDDLPQDTVNKYNKIIYNNAAYMNKLIDDLFLFSKLDMQKLDLNLEHINIKAFMEDLMEEFKLELEDRQIKFDFKDNMVDSQDVSIDRKRVNQIFRNIIGNAIKYGVEDNTAISVKLYQQKDFVCIDVEDNGPGIAEDKLPYIFNRFYRIDYARTKDLMSTGLGLAISKELVEAHGGRITASSRENVGTCFTVMFPMDK